MVAEPVIDVPVLLAGHHGNPRRGACLMEVVSAVPGGPWTDHPALVPPVLAAACRAVNDCLPDAERASLLAFVPWIDMGRSPPATLMRAELGERLARLAESYPGGPLPGSGTRRPAVAARAVKRAIHVLNRGPAAVDLLRRLLLDSVNLVRASAGLDLVSEPDLRIRSVVRSLPMKISYFCPGDRSWAYPHCAADVAGWPPELIPDWLIAEPGGPPARGPGRSATLPQTATGGMPFSAASTVS